MSTRNRILLAATAVGLVLCASPSAYAADVTLDPSRVGNGFYLVTEYVSGGYSIEYKDGKAIITTTDGTSPDLWVAKVVGTSTGNQDGIVGADGQPFDYGRTGSFLATMLNSAYVDTSNIPLVTDTGYAVQPEITSRRLPIVDGIPFERGYLFPPDNPLGRPQTAYINLRQWAEEVQGIQLTSKDIERLERMANERWLVAGELILSVLLRYDPSDGKWDVIQWSYRFIPDFSYTFECVENPEACGGLDDEDPPVYTATMRCQTPVWAGEVSECRADIALADGTIPYELTPYWWSPGVQMTYGTITGDKTQMTSTASVRFEEPGEYTVYFIAEAYNRRGDRTAHTGVQNATVEVRSPESRLTLKCNSPVKVGESSACSATAYTTPERTQTLRWYHWNSAHKTTDSTLSAGQTTGANGAPQTVFFTASKAGTYTVRAEMLDEHSNVLAHRDAIIEVTDPHEQNHCASGGSNCEKVDMPPGFVDRPPGTGTIPTIISGPGKGTPHSGGPGAPGLLTVKVLPPYPGTARENASKVGAEVRFTVSQYEGPRTVRWRTTPNDGDVPIEQELVYTSRLIWDVTFYDTSGNPVAMYRKTENLSISDAGTVRTLTIPDVYLHQHPGTAGIAVRVQEERTRRWREDRGHLTDGMVWDSCAIYHDVDHNPDDEEPGTYHCHGGYVFDPSAVRWVSNWTHANLITSGFEQPWSNEPVREHVGGLRYEVTGAGSSLR